MKQKGLILLLVIFSLSSTAQTILLSVDNTKVKTTEIGPNLKRHNQLFFRLGFVDLSLVLSTERRIVCAVDDKLKITNNKIKLFCFI